MMYKILDEDTIKNEIIPYLPRAKRGFQVTIPLEEIVNAIIFKLKTGTQGHLLPVESFFKEKNSRGNQSIIIIEDGVKPIL
ncbi:transposase [Avibacterium avium]|uniref:transposase n=1 Tax=Avibacterium avium TaxID=751 RepID=UPI003BF7A877